MAGSDESEPAAGAADPVEAEPFSPVEVVLVRSETVPDTSVDPVESDELAPESDIVVLDAAAKTFPVATEPVAAAAAAATLVAAAEKLAP